MTVDLKSVTKLRELTGAGIADCRAALEEADGDTDKAIEVLRKHGVIKAANKSERLTKEGVIALAKGENKVAVVALACETDFVARTQEFINIADEFTQKANNFQAESQMLITKLNLLTENSQ